MSQLETVKVKDKSGNEIIVNKSDAHLYTEFNKPKDKKKAVTKKAK
jgi:hypothetical protein